MAENAAKSAFSENGTSTSYDVVIVGAGIIGLSIARHFLLHSNFYVAIVDASTPLSSGATGAGQGYIWMIHKTPGTALWNLALRSQQLWQMFADNLQDQGINPLQAVGWKKTGSLLVGRTKEDSEQLKNRVQQLSTAGLKAEYWSAPNLLLEEPELDLSPEGCAAFLPDDAHVDVHAAVNLIEKDNKLFISQNRYAEFYNDPAVNLLRSSKDGKVEAVQTSKNNILYAKKAVVVAAGSWTGSLMQKLTQDFEVTVNVPVQPRKGYLLVIENFQSILQLNHGTAEAGYVDYYKKLSQENSTSTDSISMAATIDANGNLLIGSSRQFVGFNTDLDMNVVKQIWERAQEFFPALRKFSLESLSQDLKVRTGFRPYMPDGKPVIGPVPAMPNVFLATGHEGGGISMALGTAELIADMVLGNSCKIDPSPFAVEGRCS